MATLEKKPKSGAHKGSAKNGKKKLTKTELKKYKNLLWELRDRIVEEITFLSGDNVNRSSSSSSHRDIERNDGDAADQGAVNFDREFALSLMSTEQDVVYEIDEALQRVKDGTYGVCEMSGDFIEKERLQVIPYARYSVAAKMEMEQEGMGVRGRRR